MDYLEYTRTYACWIYIQYLLYVLNRSFNSGPVFKITVVFHPRMAKMIFISHLLIIFPLGAHYPSGNQKAGKEGQVLYSRREWSDVFLMIQACECSAATSPAATVSTERPRRAAHACTEGASWEVGREDLPRENNKDESLHPPIFLSVCTLSPLTPGSCDLTFCKVLKKGKVLCYTGAVIDRARHEER